MLPRLLLVGGLTLGVMLPLVWAAFAPVPAVREDSDPPTDPVLGAAEVSRQDLPQDLPIAPPPAPSDVPAQPPESTTAAVDDRKADDPSADDQNPALFRFEDRDRARVQDSGDSNPAEVADTEPAATNAEAAAPPMTSRRGGSNGSLDSGRPDRRESRRNKTSGRAGWTEIMRDSGWLKSNRH